MSASWPDGLPAGARARKLAAIAKEKSPLWRKLLRDVDPFLTAWTMFPVVDREMISRSLDESFTDPRMTAEVVARHFSGQAAELLFGEYYVFCSAGAMGTPLYYAYDRKTWAAYGEALMRAMARAGMSADVPVALLGSDDSRHTLPRLAPLFRSAHVIGLQEGTDTAWQKLAAMMPSTIIGYSSALSMAARAQLRGELRVSPRYILAGSDYLSPSDRNAIVAAWGVEPYTYYSVTEAGIVASQCREGGFLHVHSDQVLVEERAGELLVTQLTNEAQPTLRYRLPERGRLRSGQCPCGSLESHLVVEPGRTRRPFTVTSPTGRRVEVHPIVIRSAIDQLGTGLAVTWDAAASVFTIAGPEGLLDPARAAVEHALARSGLPMPVRTTCAEGT